MLRIDQSTLASLGFDFDKAVTQLREAREQHRFTVDVPAPTAHWLVEAAVNAGGYEVEPSVTPLMPTHNEEPAPKPEPDEGERARLEQQKREREDMRKRLYTFRSDARKAAPRDLLKQVADLLLLMYGFDAVTDDSVDAKLRDGDVR